MARFVAAVFFAFFTASPLPAVDFLGIELCKGGVKTSVKMPEGSELEIENVGVGKHGGLVMLLAAGKGDTLSLIDDLMASYTGAPGSGDEKTLQWSGNQIVALASFKGEGRAVLAVSTSDECLAEKAPVAPASPATPPTAARTSAPVVVEETSKAATAAVIAPVVVAEKVEAKADFELLGELKHSPAEDSWVDVMGVVINSSGSGYQLASFDLSFFDAHGKLICVDTISVSELKAGQQRPFRDSIQCPDYASHAVASHQLHFAGGY